ncbi:alcohol dehydrogenase catalytic domain-containing protein, partial [Kitasatospora sp. NPDC085895]|uniref:alcohol dehydrogenase catalytic domain-containing protein n=1 Tax=Kitasatospora sp. NPDC085895 TaxID=3155057 RepID=UPI00344CE7D7
MLRIRHEVDGGPEVLFAEEVDRPEAGAGEVLIRVEAVGVTLPPVRKVREGCEPVPLGGEVAGKIVALGAGVTAFSVGDRVTGLCFADAYAEFAVLNTAMASPVPDGAAPRVGGAGGGRGGVGRGGDERSGEGGVGGEGFSVSVYIG